MVCYEVYLRKCTHLSLFCRSKQDALKQCAVKKWKNQSGEKIAVKKSTALSLISSTLHTNRLKLSTLLFNLRAILFAPLLSCFFLDFFSSRRCQTVFLKQNSSILHFRMKHKYLANYGTYYNIWATIGSGLTSGPTPGVPFSGSRTGKSRKTGKSHVTIQWKLFAGWSTWQLKIPISGLWIIEQKAYFDFHVQVQKSLG